MSHEKAYPHLRNEKAQLRTICVTELQKEYGGQVSDEVTARLDRELAAFEAHELTGVMLILRDVALRADLRRYEVVPCGALGASLVVWLCGLSPFNPMETVLPLYPAFCFGYDWETEPSLEFRVPTGRSDTLNTLLRESEGVGDAVPPTPGHPGRILIPEDNSQPAPPRAYCKTIFGENEQIRLLSRLAAQTHADPEKIRLDDEDVLHLFRAVNHPAGVEDAGFPPSALGLLGVEADAFEVYANEHAEVTSFADTVRIDALLRSTGTWKDNQDDLVYGSDHIVPFSELITCCEDVYEYCRDKLGYGEKDAFSTARSMKYGKLPPSREGLPDSFRKIMYLWTRAHSYGFLLTAWRCAWYRLHHPQAFYRAYFEIVANPLVRDAVFAGKSIVDGLTPYPAPVGDPLLRQKTAFNVDLTVAQEMYRRGIELSVAP